MKMSSRYTSSSYSSSSSGQSSSSYTTQTSKSSYTSVGLPADEYRTLQKRQNRDRVEAHFRGSSGSSNYSSSTSSLSPNYPHHRRGDSGDSTYSQRSYTSYQEARLPHAQRVHISEAKNATRRALGPSFSFTDEYDNQASNYPATTQTTALSGGRRSRGNHTEREPIPQKYLDEYHAWSRADDEKYNIDDRHPYKADYISNAQWHTHDGVHVAPAPTAAATPILCPTPMKPYYKTPSSLPSHSPLRSHHRLERVYSVMQDVREQPNYEYEYAQPRLVSKFSFDSDDGVEVKKRSFFRRRRH